jgi:hypothetical protein
MSFLHENDVMSPICEIFDGEMMTLNPATPSLFASFGPDRHIKA